MDIFIFLYYNGAAQHFKIKIAEIHLELVQVIGKKLGNTLWFYNSKLTQLPSLCFKQFVETYS